jgi:hypothetical protein
MAATAGSSLIKHLSLEAFVKARNAGRYCSFSGVILASHFPQITKDVFGRA